MRMGLCSLILVLALPALGFNAKDPNLFNHAASGPVGSSALALPGERISTPSPSVSLPLFYSANYNPSIGSVIPHAAPVSRNKNTSPSSGNTTKSATPGSR